MDDGDFDTRLRQRLRAYESRLPETDAPDPRHVRPSRGGLGWPAVAGVLGVAIVVGALAGVLLLERPTLPVGEASQTPVVSSPPSAAPVAPSDTPAPTVAPTTTPTATPPSDPLALDWRQTAAFGGGGATVAHDVVHGDRGYLAVGVEYDAALPNLGPTPSHRGRVWQSADGTAWEQISADDGFVSVTLQWLTIRPDGAYLAIGTRYEPAEFGGMDPADTVLFESSDGQAWREVPSPFPAGSLISDLAHGARGVVALVMRELWFSPDGHTWEVVSTPGQPEATGPLDLDAGPEGFALVGDAAEYPVTAPYVRASGDGRTWFQSTAPPDRTGSIASLSGDWLIVANPAPGEGDLGDAATWTSANALDWQRAGSMSLEVVPIGGASCHEFVFDAFGAGNLTFASTILAYPCSEGGFQTKGTQRFSADGVTWSNLPLTATAAPAGEGAAIRAAAAGGESVVIVGQIDNRAGFWLGTPR